MKLGGADVPWCGGSNITTNKRASPRSTYATRPQDLRNRLTLEPKLTEGLPEEQQLDTPIATQKPGAKVPLTNWILRVKTALEKMGMDTVFRVIDLSSEQEIYLLENWGQLPAKEVDSWVTHLQTGIPPATPTKISRPSTSNTPCPEDLYNLEMSGQFLQRSITTDMYALIQTEIQNATGPQIFAHIVGKHQIGTNQAVRRLVDDLQKLSLSAEPKENVETPGNPS